MNKNWGAWMMGGFLFALASAVIGEWQDPLDIKKVGTLKDYGQGLLLLGSEKQPAKARHLKIGHTNRWESDTVEGRSFEFRLIEAGVRDHSEGLLYPTDEQFDEWLASGSRDLQEWLKDNG